VLDCQPRAQRKAGSHEGKSLHYTLALETLPEGPLRSEGAGANVTHRHFSTAPALSESRLLLRAAAVMKVARSVRIDPFHSELPMFRILLESKIHRATVTGCDLMAERFTAALGVPERACAKDNPWDI
jgi:hypothetical protein